MIVTKQEIQTWRSDLKTQQKLLETTFLVHKNPKKLFAQHTQLIDELLQTIWQKANVDSNASLIAVGGYGRGELFPYSDIDLLILLPDAASQLLNTQIEAIIGLLWDEVRHLEYCGGRWTRPQVPSLACVDCRGLQHLRR